MEFFVRKESLEPILKLQLVQDGRNDFDAFYDKLSNSTIKFSMRKVENGVYKILNRAGGIVQKTKESINAGATILLVLIPTLLKAFNSLLAESLP